MMHAKTRQGFTLLEMMIAVAIFTIVLGTLYGLASSMGESAQLQEARTATVDDARIVLTALTRELRQASRPSISANALPSDTLQYRVADDINGNGYAVDVNGFIELSPLRTVGRDTDDANDDGQVLTQVVVTENGGLRVIGNGLAPDEDANDNGALDAGEDLNSNNRVERGLWFERSGRGLTITVETQRQVGPENRFVVSRLTETVFPRN